MLLSMQAVSAGYGKNQVLHDLSLHVEEGEIAALVGPNGAGKTTTLRCVAGIARPSRGSIVFAGEDLGGVPTFRIIARGISYCPEGRDVFGNLTVYENLKMGAYLVSSRRDFESQLEWIYDLFPRLADRKSQLSASLSGGEQQMLAIARSLMTRPRLILLDEPSLGLAPVLIESIYGKIEEINRSGVSILLVEQNVSMALEISHRGYVMEGGEIRLEAPSKELIENEHVKNAYLGVV